MSMNDNDKYKIINESKVYIPTIILLEKIIDWNSPNSPTYFNLESIKELASRSLSKLSLLFKFNFAISSSKILLV